MAGLFIHPFQSDFPFPSFPPSNSDHPFATCAGMARCRGRPSGPWVPGGACHMPAAAEQEPASLRLIRSQDGLLLVARLPKGVSKKDVRWEPAPLPPAPSARMHTWACPQPAGAFRSPPQPCPLVPGVPRPRRQPLRP